MISEIYNRQSIRKFIDKSISEKDIIDIIKSGVKAPFSKKKHYDNKENLQDIIELKEAHSDNMTDKFNFFLDIMEHLLSEE